MVIKWFLKHQWLEMTRSSIWQRSLVLNIVIGFLLFLMLVNFLFLGLLIDEILDSTQRETLKLYGIMYVPLSLDTYDEEHAAWLTDGHFQIRLRKSLTFTSGLC